MSDLELLGYIPGAVGRIVELHAKYYHHEWGFGRVFETKVAAELSAFADRYNEARDGFWTVCRNRKVEGSIIIDGIKAESEGAHLRWFIMSPPLHGRGFGNKLMEEAVKFCEKRQYHRVYLWTFEGLDAARHLYEKFGFNLVFEQEGTQWGTKVKEQKFILEFTELIA